MPGQIMKHLERAGVVLTFIVVGGCVSGLATAYTLQKAGHEVIILEKTDGRTRNISGLRSPPHMTKLLYQWGLGPTLEHSAQQCQAVNFFSGESGDYIGTMDLAEDFLKDLVAGHMFLQQGELETMLSDLAKQEGVQFRFNTKVTGVDSATGHVTLQSGEKLYADIIVGADGYDSILRPIVTGVQEDITGPGVEKHLILTFTIPATLLVNEEELKPFLDPAIWSLWMGNGYLVHSNLLNAGRDYTVTLATYYNGPIIDGDDDWRVERPLKRYGIDFSTFDPRTQKLFNLASHVSSRVFATRSCLDNLVCEHSRLVLVGGAAHPLLPVGHHGIALALEDAQTLGLLFSRIQHKSQVFRLLTAYDEIRQPRTVSIQKYDYEHQGLFKTPTGPVQEARDARLRMTLVHTEGGHMDEANFLDIWGDELAIFAHDATEKVEDWWGQWGSMVLRRNRQSMSVEVNVSKNDELEIS